MANEYTKRYLEKRKSQKEQTPSLYQLAKERTESQLKSYTPQPTQKQPAKTTTRVNKLDVQDERAYQSKKRSSFSERMKTAGSSSISDQLKSFSKERSLIRQYERDKRKKESDVFEAPFKITPSVSDSEKISYGMGGTPFSSIDFNTLDTLFWSIFPQPFFKKTFKISSKPPILSKKHYSILFPKCQFLPSTSIEKGKPFFRLPFWSTLLLLLSLSLFFCNNNCLCLFFCCFGFFCLYVLRSLCVNLRLKWNSEHQ